MDIGGIKIRSCDIFLAPLQTRMPFKYGIATITHVPHTFVRLVAEFNGKLSVGISADLLPPKWFTKDPNRAVRDEIVEMARVLEKAARLILELEGSTVFEIWWRLYQAQDAWGREQGLPSLLAHFGTSLVERALIEAACRAADKPFARMLINGTLGLQLDQIHFSLKGRKPSDFLAAPLSSIIIRHTVGLADPLAESEISNENRLHDGLPQSLEASIQRYGLGHFKIKVTGALEQDVNRLERIAVILRQSPIGQFQFSLDGNEQFKSMLDFRSYWNALKERATLQPMFHHLLFVEQPVHRDSALESEVGSIFAEWPDRPPIIIDESDGTLDSLPRALALGYNGTSHKNCKGIFKGIANRCLLFERSRRESNRSFLMSGEDLCNIGPVAVIQDLAVMAALGILSVERNGHHYFPGLSMFPENIQTQVATSHPDLYHSTAQGWPTIHIENGIVAIGSLNRAPFGVGFIPDVEQFIPIHDFKF